MASFLQSWALKYEMLSSIWYHLYNLKNVRNTHGGVLKACNLLSPVLPYYSVLAEKIVITKPEENFTVPSTCFIAILI